jgi:hypothetical protein
MGVHDMVQAHCDRIVEIRHQLALSKSKVKAIVVPGQSSATPVPNDSAVIIQGSDILSLLTIAQPTGINRLIQGKHHHETLKVKIMKDNFWTDDQFNKVAWQEFHSAFKGVSCSHRISITKMTNQLWHSNSQNKKFYGSSDICSVCNSIPEMIELPSTADM